MSSIGTLAMNIIANSAAFKAAMDGVDARIRETKAKAAEGGGGGGMFQQLLGGGKDLGMGLGMAAMEYAAGPALALKSIEGIVEKFKEIGGEMLSASRSAGQLGVSSGEAWGLHEAAQQAGTDADTIDHGFMHLERRIAEAKHGSAEAAAQFSELGLDASALDAEGASDAFRDFAGALLAIPDRMERIRQETEAFGRQGPETERALFLWLQRNPGEDQGQSRYIDAAKSFSQGGKQLWAEIQEYGMRGIGELAIGVGEVTKGFQEGAVALGLWEDHTDKITAKMAEQASAARDRMDLAALDREVNAAIERENAEREKATNLEERLRDNVTAVARGWGTGRAEAEQMIATLVKSGELNDRDLVAIEERLRKTGDLHDAELAVAHAREAQLSPAERMRKTSEEIAQWVKEGAISTENAAVLARESRMKFADQMGKENKLPELAEKGSAEAYRELVNAAQEQDFQQQALALQQQQLAQLGIVNDNLRAIASGQP